MQTQLAAIAARHGGPFTREQALLYGYTPKAIRHRLRTGRWRRLRAGVYIERQVYDRSRDPVQRHSFDIAAAILAFGPGGAVGSHHSAALIHGLNLLRTASGVTITCPPDRESRAARASVHVHCASLPTTHVRRHGGVPITSAPRTVVDMARVLRYEEALVVADSALHQSRASRAELEDVLRYCWSWPGVGRAARVIRFADPLSESALESLARLLFAKCEVPAPQTQVVLEDGWQVLARVDFYWPKYGVIGEADGMLKYDGAPHALRAEKLRQERLEEAGYIVVRFTWDDVVRRPRQTVERIRAAFARGAAKRAGSS